MKKLIIPIAIIALILLKSSAFIVDEGKQAIITQFGKPIGEPITNAGFHFKKPFVQEVQFVDKRILSWDGDPNQVPTKDKKFIEVDTTARWRIVDPLKFIVSLRNERAARNKLDAILDGHTRDIIANHNLVEAVRNTNQIIAVIKNKQEAVKDGKLSPEEEEVVDFSSIQKVSVGREKLSEIIAGRADKELNNYGITIIDVQLRRISYEKSVEAKVYDRMVSERQRIAQKLRSVGKGEEAKINGRRQRDLERIKSEAYQTSQKIRGEGEAKAAAIYAKALSRGPKFYEFIRKLDAYKKSLKKDTHLILTSDSEFLNLLKSDR